MRSDTTFEERCETSRTKVAAAISVAIGLAALLVNRKRRDKGMFALIALGAMKGLQSYALARLVGAPILRKTYDGARTLYRTHRAPCVNNNGTNIGPR